MRKPVSLLLALALIAALSACGTAAGQPSAPAAGSAAPSPAETASPAAEGDYKKDVFRKDLVRIELTADAAGWRALSGGTSDGSLQADAAIDGVSCADAALSRSASSLSGVSEHPGLRLDFGAYTAGQTFMGLDALILEDLSSDPTCMKEYLACKLYEKMEVPTPLCTFADVWVNGAHYGLMLAVEAAGASFLSRVFGDDPAKAYLSTEDAESLVYTGDDPADYAALLGTAVTDVSRDDAGRLIAALKGVSESEGKDLNACADTDEVLRYAAVSVFLVNLDSYLSGLGRNSILCEDGGVLSLLPWSCGRSFGTCCGSASEAVNYPVDTAFSGVTAAERPLLGRLLADPDYLDTYRGYLLELTDYAQSGKIDKEIRRASELIGTYAPDADAFAAGTEALKLFVSLRAESVLGQLDGDVPSTAETQAGSDALIDASGLDLSLLGAA